MKIDINDLPEGLRQQLVLTDDSMSELELQLTEDELLSVDRLSAANGVTSDVMLRALIDLGFTRHQGEV